MPNPNHAQREGRFENAKFAAVAGFVGACIAPVTEVAMGSQHVMEHMTLYTKLGLTSALGFIALEVADYLLPRANPDNSPVSE